MPGLHVQYGSGFSCDPSWRNFDASPTLRLERLPVVGRLVKKNAQRFPEAVEYGDIVRGLPVPDGSCAGIYASHVLEHLALGDFRRALVNTYRLLQPGGLFRLVVPDLEALVAEYSASRAPDAALALMERTALGTAERARGPLGLARQWLGNSQHLWMWDYKALEQELSRHGFSGIRRCAAGDSGDPMFVRVEDPGRFVQSVGIECRRPPRDADARERGR